jgi:hypothetical protein
MSDDPNLVQDCVYIYLDLIQHFIDFYTAMHDGDTDTFKSVWKLMVDKRSKFPVNFFPQEDLRFDCLTCTIQEKLMPRLGKSIPHRTNIEFLMSDLNDVACRYRVLNMEDWERYKTCENVWFVD